VDAALNSEEVDPSISMDSLLRYPAISDWRGPNKLLLAIASLRKNLKPRMIPVGRFGTSILFVPTTTQECFFTWDFRCPFFSTWKLNEDEPLKRLVEAAQQAGPATSGDKGKLSGKARTHDNKTGDDSELASTRQKPAMSGEGSASASMSDD
jgi:hypothetical protein